jgi:ACR3 family arsenite transporter
MPGESCVTKEPKGLGFFEKYLTVWVLLCIGIGILLGSFAPELAH